MLVQRPKSRLLGQPIPRILTPPRIAKMRSPFPNPNRTWSWTWRVSVRIGAGIGGLPIANFCRVTWSLRGRHPGVRCVTQSYDYSAGWLATLGIEFYRIYIYHYVILNLALIKLKAWYTVHYCFYYLYCSFHNLQVTLHIKPAIYKYGTFCFQYSESI